MLSAIVVVLASERVIKQGSSERTAKLFVFASRILPVDIRLLCILQMKAAISLKTKWRKTCTFPFTKVFREPKKRRFLR